MNTYKVRNGVINGEALQDMVDLCNEYFVDPFVQPYAGARQECMFCGAMRQNDGSADHSAADCPVLKYYSLTEKHDQLIHEAGT